MKEIKKYKLSSSSNLIKTAWETYKKRWQDLIVISALVSLLTYLINFIDFYYVRIVDPIVGYLAQTILLVLSGLIMALGSASIIYVLSGKKGSVEQIIRKALPLTVPLFILGWVSNFILAGSTMPLIIPGLILLIAFIFVPFVYLLEKRQWLDALLRSSNLTKGFKWSLIRKYFVLFLWIFFLIIPIFLATNLFATLTKTIELNSIASILTTTLMFPFVLSFSFAIYSELNKVAPKSKFIPSQKGKNIYTFLFIWGVIVFLSIAVARFSYPDKEIFNENYFIQRFEMEINKLEKKSNNSNIDIDININQSEDEGVNVKIN